MHRGYIKLWRKSKLSSVWQMPPLYGRIWSWILMSVNYEPREIPTPAGPIFINPGQRITSLRQIADEVSWYEYGVLKTPNVKTIKTVLEWLEGNGQCTAVSNAKGTLITVINWDTYNGNGVNQDSESNTDGTAEGNTERILTRKEKKKEDKTLSASGDAEQEFFLTKKKKRLAGKRLETFNLFWDAFGYKKGKAEAADAWLDLPSMTMSTVGEIVAAAKMEAENRHKLEAAGKTPKMAQGWLSGRRWEDEREPEAWRQNY